MVESRHHGNALVIGGSMAGLLAARVLADHFARVTLVERDILPHGPEQRRGVPQGQHVHGLLAGGQRALEGLFPGLTADLVSEGATAIDVVADTIWHQAGGYGPQFASGLCGISLSRPLLEAGIRHRVRALANVTVLEGHEVIGLVTSGDRARVTGVTVRRRSGEATEEALAAELVVDAGGRGSRAASWLEDLGFGRPAEERIVVGVGYTSRLYRRRPGDLPGAKAASYRPTPPHGTRLGILMPLEGDRWIATLAGWLGDHAPANDEGFLAFARSFAAPDIHGVISRAEPLGGFTTHKFPANLRRRYERLARVPDGYAVVGDALCSFNPTYGQGMTTAALGVLALDRCLREARGDLRGLPNRYYRRAAEVIDTPWRMAAGGDFAYPGVTGQRAPGTAVVNGYMGRVLIAATAFKTSDYVAMVDGVRPRCAALEHVVYLGTPDWDELLARADRVTEDELRERAAALQFDDAINIQYTSGTTGAPKGAVLSHHNILNNGFFVGEGCGYTPGDRVCIPVPFYHCFGMVLGNLACTTHAACMVIPAPAFEPVAVLEAVQAERCTALYGVPTMFIAELEHPDFERYDLSSLRTGIMAGSPCPVEVMRKVVDRMHMSEVTICYGMTETSPVSTQTGADDPLDKRVGTVGRIHPHVEIKIVDPIGGAVVPRTETGELLTRGYSVMLGYWNAPEQTAEAIDRAGWMHTGDLATMDDEGYVNIVGRSKDMVIRGGENVYPREVEEFLYGHPDIADVQVVGVPDPRYGEELCAFVIARSGATVDPDAIRDWCRERIAHYKVPRYVIAVDEFPMTVTGKIQKYRLRETAVESLDLGAAVTQTA